MPTGQSRGMPAKLYLVRDLLDKLLVDRQHQPLGRADRIVLVLEDNDTLRVARVRSRTPSPTSSRRIVWLSADCETPSLAAALVKLRSRATATSARRSSRLPRCIYQLRL